MLENFTRLLSSLLAAGVPLSRALVILVQGSCVPAGAAQSGKRVHDLVIDGMSLADAMAKSPETFPRVYVAMVEAGETGGFLDVVLAQIADFQSREKEMRSKVMTAMLYPAILLVLAVGCVGLSAGVFYSALPVHIRRIRADLPFLTSSLYRRVTLCAPTACSFWWASWSAGFLLDWLVSDPWPAGSGKG